MVSPSTCVDSIIEGVGKGQRSKRLLCSNRSTKEKTFEGPQKIGGQTLRLNKILGIRSKKITK
jgi:hypothetical protein